MALLGKAVALRAVALAFDEHMRTLFGAYVRHLAGGGIAEAKTAFRKDFAIARQAHDEMTAHINEASF